MSDPFRSDLEAAHQRIEQLEAEHEKRVAELEEENRRLRARLIDQDAPRPRSPRRPGRVVLPVATMVLGLSLAFGMLLARKARPIAMDAPLPLPPVEVQEIPDESPPNDVDFDRHAAAEALRGVRVQQCAMPGGPHGSGHVKVTFSPNGAAVRAQADQPPFTGSKVGECVAHAYLDARVPPFSGSPVTVGKSFYIAE